MTKANFLKTHNLSESQFSGEEKISGDLYLSSLTSIPAGFNPTVGGDLYLRSERKYIRSNVASVEINKKFFWSKNGTRYGKIDGMFCEILTDREYVLHGETYVLYSARKVNREEYFFIANKGKFYAHATDLKKALSDLQFKVISETLKHAPIYEETVITRQYYRLITGACEFGIDMWVRQNKLESLEEITAGELMKYLKKTSPYGFEKFKSLVKF